MVVRDLVWTYDKIHLAVIHVQPSYGTLVVIVCLQGFCFSQEIVPNARLDCDVSRHLKVVFYLFNVGLVGIVIPYCFQRAVRGATDKCIRAVLVRIVPGFKLLHRHIRRIKTSSGRTIIIAFHKRFAIGAVPWAVIDLGESLLQRVGHSVKQGLFVTEVLTPINGIDYISGIAVKPEDLFSMVCDAAQIWSVKSDHRIIRHFASEGRFRRFSTGYCDRERDSGKNQILFHYDKSFNIDH